MKTNSKTGPLIIQVVYYTKHKVPHNVLWTEKNDFLSLPLTIWRRQQSELQQSDLQTDIDLS